MISNNLYNADKFKTDLMKIAMTTLSSKILSQDKEHFANMAVDAVMRLKVTNLNIMLWNSDYCLFFVLLAHSYVLFYSIMAVVIRVLFLALVYRWFWHFAGQHKPGGHSDYQEAWWFSERFIFRWRVCLLKYSLLSTWSLVCCDFSNA